MRNLTLTAGLALGLALASFGAHAAPAVDVVVPLPTVTGSGTPAIEGAVRRMLLHPSWRQSDPTMAFANDVVVHGSLQVAVQLPCAEHPRAHSWGMTPRRSRRNSTPNSILPPD